MFKLIGFQKLGFMIHVLSLRGRNYRY